jgi:biopolymer transport protein ExbD
MVTAKLIVARGIEIDKPKAASGGDVPSTLRVAVKPDPSGTALLYVNGEQFTDDVLAIARIKQIAAATDKPKAVIAGDRKTAYGGVMHAIDLVEQAGVTAIALENERP